MSDAKTHFQKKVYTYQQLPQEYAMHGRLPHGSFEQSKESQKKIHLANTNNEYRDQHRQVYLPIWIEICGIEAKLTQYQSQDMLLLESDGKYTPPEDLLRRLETLKEEMDEANRWLQGTLRQLDKAMKTAKELTHNKEESTLEDPLKKPTFIQRWKALIKKIYK